MQGNQSDNFFNSWCSFCCYLFGAYFLCLCTAVLGFHMAKGKCLETLLFMSRNLTSLQHENCMKAVQIVKDLDPKSSEEFIRYYNDSSVTLLGEKYGDDPILEGRYGEIGYRKAQSFMGTKRAIKEAREIEARAKIYQNLKTETEETETGKTEL